MNPEIKSILIEEVPKMFLEERQAKILDLLERNGKVLVKELAEIFSVTEDSIRKDLSALELDGKLKRTYGGAVSIKQKLQMTEANKRRISDVEAKRKIASAAFQLLRPNQLIFLDISTINIALAQMLEKTDVRYKILTNMIDVLVILARNPNIELLFAGGLINQSRDGFSDALNLDFLSKFRPDISFIGTAGCHIQKNSLSTHNTNDALHKARMIELSKYSCVVAESRKLNVEANFCFSSLDRVDALITDAELSAELTAKAEKLGVKIFSAV